MFGARNSGSARHLRGTVQTHCQYEHQGRPKRNVRSDSFIHAMALRSLLTLVRSREIIFFKLSFFRTFFQQN
jgi:hypothetical protein